MAGRARQAYLGLGILFNVGVVVQFFLAGLGIFGAESFAAHKDSEASSTRPPSC
jgi:hypothetical protein